MATGGDNSLLIGLHNADADDADDYNDFVDASDSLTLDSRQPYFIDNENEASNKYRPQGGELQKYVENGIHKALHQRNGTLQAPVMRGGISLNVNAADGDGKVFGKGQSIGIQYNLYDGKNDTERKSNLNGTQQVPWDPAVSVSLDGSLENGSPVKQTCHIQTGSLVLCGNEGETPVRWKVSMNLGKINGLSMHFEETIGEKICKSIWTCSVDGVSFLWHMWTSGARSLVRLSQIIYQRYRAHFDHVETSSLIFVFYHDSKDDAKRMEAEQSTVLSLIKLILDEANIDTGSLNLDVSIIGLNSALKYTPNENYGEDTHAHLSGLDDAEETKHKIPKVSTDIPLGKQNVAEGDAYTGSIHCDKLMSILKYTSNESDEELSWHSYEDAYGTVDAKRKAPDQHFVVSMKTAKAKRDRLSIFERFLPGVSRRRRQKSNALDSEHAGDENCSVLSHVRETKRIIGEGTSVKSLAKANTDTDFIHCDESISGLISTSKESLDEEFSHHEHSTDSENTILFSTNEDSYGSVDTERKIPDHFNIVVSTRTAKRDRLSSLKQWFPGRLPRCLFRSKKPIDEESEDNNFKFAYAQDTFSSIEFLISQLKMEHVMFVASGKTYGKTRALARILCSC